MYEHSLISWIFRTIGESSHQQNPGVFVEYQESVKKSIQELVEIGVVPNSGALNLRLKIKDGMDGAGHQLKIKGAEYPSMELFGYVILEVYEISSSVSLLYSILRNYKIPLHPNFFAKSIPATP